MGDTTEFQFAFRRKITWNYTFEATNCRRIIFDFLSVRGTTESVVSFTTVIWSHHATRSLSNGDYMALGDETKQRLRETTVTSKCGTDAFCFYLEVFEQ